MTKKPRTTGEHIVSLYGHIKGLTREIHLIKTNHLKHMHDDIDKLDRKVDKIETKTDNLLYWIIGGAFTTILTLTGLFNLFLN